MDKKSLVALMMTAPALSMFASGWDYTTNAAAGLLSYTVDPNFETGSWTSDETSLPDPTVSQDGLTVLLNNLCPSIHTNLTLPNGSYSLSFSGLSNAYLEINGKLYGATKDAKGNITLTNGTQSNVSFTVGGKDGFSNTITIVAYQYNKMVQWGVGEVKIDFLCDFAKIYDALEDELNLINSYLQNASGKDDNGLVDPADSRKAEVDALKARFAALIATRNTLAAQVKSVTVGPIDKETSNNDVFTRLLANYTKYNLAAGEYDNDIYLSLEDLLDEVEVYKKDVKAENEIAATIKKNTDNLEKFTKKTSGYYDRIAADLKAATDGFKNDKVSNYNVKGAEKEYLEYVGANAKANIEAALAELKAAVTAAYANLENPDIDFESLENEALSILYGQIPSYAAGYPQAIKDWAAYGYFVGLANADVPSVVAAGSKNLADVELISTQEFQKIDKIGASHNGVYADIVENYKADLNDIYKNNRGYTINQTGGLKPTNPNIAGACDNYHTANTDMVKRINDMPSVAQNFQNFVNFQEGMYSTANSAISSATVGGSNIDDVLALPSSAGFSKLTPDQQKTLSDLISKMATAYKNWQNVTNALYRAHELGDMETGQFNHDYTQARNKFNSACNAYVIELNKTSNAGLVGKLQVMEKFESTKNEVSDKFSGLKYSTDLEKRFSGSYTKVSGWIAEYVTQVDVVNAAQSTLIGKQNALNSANNTVSTAQTQYNNAVTAKSNAESALTVAKVTLDQAQVAYDRLLNSLTATTPQLVAAKTALDDALADYNQKADDVAAAQANEANKKKALEDAKKKAQTAQDEYDEALAAYNRANSYKTSLKNSIDTSCTTIITNAGEVYSAFQPTESKLTTLENAIKKLQAEIKKVDNKQNIVTITVDGEPAYAGKNPYVTVKVKVGNNNKDWNVNNFVEKETALDDDLSNIAKGNEVTIAGTKFDCSNPTEFLNAAKALKDQFVDAANVTYASLVDDATLLLAKNVAEANLTAIEKLNEVLTTDLYWLKQINAPGADKVNVSDNATIDSMLNQAQADVASATSVADYDNASAYMITVAEKNQISLKAVKPVYDNYISWRKLRNALGVGYDDTPYVDYIPESPLVSGMNPEINNFPVCKDVLANAEIYINTISDPTAKPYYQGLLKAIGDDIVAEGNVVTAAYKAMDASVNYTELLNQVKAINTEIENVEKACLANQTQYAALASKIDILSKSAVRIYDYINANDEVTANRDKYLGQIDDLTSELNDISKALTNSFKNGAVVADDAADKKNYTGKLKEIEDALNAIEGGESAGYKQVVIDANYAYLYARGISYDYIYKLYELAVDKVNAYRYDIENPGYYATLVGNDEFQKAHYALQSSYIALEEFNKKYAPWFESLTAGSDRSKYVVLSSFINDNHTVGAPNTIITKMPSAEQQVILTNEFNQFLKDATDLNNDIKAKEAKCTEVAKGIADSYFAAKYTNSGALNYANIRAGLITAGLTDTGSKGSQVYTALTSADFTYNDINMLLAYTNVQNTYFGKSAGTYVTNPGSFAPDSKLAKDALVNKSDYWYILGMSNVANNLDVLNPTVQSGLTNDQFVADKVNTGVNNQWNTFYGNTLNELKDYQKKAATDAGYGDEETLAQAIENAQAINAEWASDVVANATCAENYKGYKDRLLNDEAIKKALETGQNYTLDLAKEAAKNTLIGTDAASCLSQTNALLEDLLEYSGYHSTQLATIAGLQGQIDVIVGNINKDLKDNKVPNVTTYKEQFEGKFKDGKLVTPGVNQNIESAYATIFVEECNYANSMLLAKAKTAYNNANVAGKLPADPDYNQILIGLSKSVDNLEGTNVTADNRDLLMKELIGLENQYCDIINTLDEAAGTPEDRTDLGVATTTFNTLKANDIAEVNRYLDAVNAATDKYGEYSEASTAKYAPQLEAVMSEIKAVEPEVKKYDIELSLIYAIDELKYKLGEMSDEAKDINSKWTEKNKEDQVFYASDQRFEKYDAQLNGLLKDMEYAHDSLLQYDPEAADVEYTNLLNKVDQAEVGLRAVLDKMHEEHAFTTDENPVAQFDVTATAYVKATLTQAFRLAKADNVEKIGEDIAETLSQVNENGWSYDYVDYEEFVAQLFAIEKEMKDLTNEDIWQIADPTEADPDNKKATTADEAVAGYDSLQDQMKAIMDKLTALKDSPVGEKYIKGDIDGDGDLTIADVQALIALVGEEVEYVPGDVTSETQNVNSDNVINIADVTTLINLILDKQSKVNKVTRFAQVAEGNNSFVCEEVEGVNGMRRFAVSLSNEVDFVAGQLDIKLPAGAYVAGVQLADRANALEAYVFENIGSTRVLMTSLDNAMIEGNNGAMLYIDVEGNSDIEVENVVFADAAGNSYNVADNSSTGVGIMDAVKDGVKAIYNAAGQQLNKLTRGVNIVRNADGSVTKKIGK